MGSSIANTTSRVTSSASLPSVSGDKTSTAVLLVFTLQKTAEEKKETSLNKETISAAQASLKTTSNKDKGTSDKATPFESSTDQFRHFLSSSENAASNSSTPKTLLDLTQSGGNLLPVVVSASIAANYATVLLDSLSVLPPSSELTNFREPSPSPSVVDSGSVSSRKLYSSSTIIPVWTANMLGNAYGGGYVITPSIFVTNFPDSPSSSGIPPGYELSSKSENIQSSRSSTRAGVGTGGVFTLVAGPSKEEATPGVSTSASVQDGFINVLEPTTETETASSTTTKIPTSNASNHGLLLKPVVAAIITKPSLASSNSISVNETGRLNTSLFLLHSSSRTVDLAPFPLISPLVNQKTSYLLANQSVIGAYSPTSVLDFQGLAIRKSFDYSLGLIICIMAMSFIL